MVVRPQHLPRDLGTPRARMLRVAGRAEEVLVWATRAFIQQDMHLADRTISMADAVATEAASVDAACTRAIRQWEHGGPALHGLSLLQRIGPHLERVSHLAGLISARVREAGWDPASEPGEDVESLASTVSDHFTDAVDAFVHDDAQAAQTVLREGRALEHRCNALWRDRVADMTVDPRAMHSASRFQMLMVLRDLDHVIAHSSGIAQNVVRSSIIP